MEANRKNGDKIDATMCDIFYIDERIKTHISSKLSTIDSMKKDLERMVWIFQQSPIKNDKHIASMQIPILKNRIQDISHGFELALYLLRTDDLLNEYRSLTQPVKSKSFLKKNCVVLSNEVKVKLLKIQINYLQIANEYIPIANINLISDFYMKVVCQACYSPNIETSDDGRCICKDCATEMDAMDDTASFKDADRVKMATRYKYSTDGYFIAAMNNVECKQNKNVDHVIPMILEEMKMQSVTSDTITIMQLYNIILDLSLDEYYNNVYLIYFKITGHILFNITDLRAELMEMHEHVAEVYEELKNDPDDEDDDDVDELHKERESNNQQNVYLKLFKLLQLLDYPCTRDEFFYLRDIDNEGKHVKKWKRQMEILAQRYPDHVTSKGKKRWRYIPSF